jgi:hypothetical protein
MFYPGSRIQTFFITDPTWKVECKLIGTFFLLPMLSGAVIVKKIRDHSFGIAYPGDKKASNPGSGTMRKRVLMK